jgi:lipopolysaccharide/colanic/teichoic acid biosynthesis glycosyltransferase
LRKINIKRVFDIIFSAIVLLIFSPILLIISFLILIFDGRRILFRQNRTGLNRQTFIFYKFRTMKPIYNEFGEKLQDANRITRLGRFLRETSLDELPSFINVIKGDMSVVGPRPLLEEYVERYDNDQLKRLNVKPGVTGLAQINGRNSISWEEKFFYDLQYVENHNFFIDLKIILFTLKFVFKREGISPENNEIMPEFKSKKITDKISK